MTAQIKMVVRSYLLLVLFHDILTQSVISEDLIKLQLLNSCGESDYYDVALLQCIKCGNGVANQENYQKRSDDGLSCICKPGHRYTKYLGPPSNIECQPCPNEKVPSIDKWGCQKCDFDIATNSCKPCDKQYLEVERDVHGIMLPSRTCQLCSADTEPNSSKGRCERCSFLTIEASGGGCECPKDQKFGGLCFPKSKIIADNSNLYKVPFEKMKDLDSVYFRDNIRAAISACKEYQNGTACQQLGNLCVLLHYNMDNMEKLLSPDACSEYQNILDQVPKKLLTNFPKLYYLNDKAKSILERTSISQQFFFNKQSLSSQLRFKAAKFALNGEFLGLLDSEPQDLQLCLDRQERMATAFLFGTTYVQSCLINVQDLLKKYKLIFYDLYLCIQDNETPYLYPVPVRNEQLRKGGEFVNQDNNMNNWILTRRFFLVDNVIGKTMDKNNKVLEGENSILPKVLRYAEHFSIQVNLQKEDTGKIYPPYVHIRYAEVDKDDLENNKFVKVTFSVSYSMNIDKFLQDLSIAMGVMGALSIIWSIIKTWGWSKRAGRPEVDFFFLVKLIIHTGETLSNVILMTIYGASLWWFILYKRQDVVYLFLPTYDQEYFFRLYLGLALALKWVELIHMILQQITVDIFFIDWERPRGPGTQTNLLQLEQKEQTLSVSIWRTYFIVNEWNEIQSIRRINSIFQVFCVLFFLKVLKFENWASLDPYGSSSAEPDSSISRFVIAVSLYAGLGLIQWLFFVLIYERFIEDKIRQFVDTCSMSNISVFIMTHAQFGYYIHGRSVHGRADVDMKEMHEQLKKEEDDLVGQRGLVPNTDHQTFTICLPKSLRQHYNKVIQPITVLSQISSRFPGANLGGPTNIDRVVLAYHTINRFLSAFIDHSLKDLDYIVKDKQLIEGLLDVEFQDTSEKGIFYNDANSNSFTNVLFYGNELTLLLFDILLFCVIDLISKSFILAGILTYFIGQLVLRIRDILGQKNLARKTLVDERFLI